ncbi:MAG: nucleoid-associated protein, partial [Clostridia bacterium]|nr:nucleoid-associated protein [Clostridia bacterium]
SPEAVLSNYPTALDDDSADYLKTHIVKAFNSDDAKKCAFDREGFVSSQIQDVRHNFVEFSQELARRFFGVMQDAGTIPSGDLIVLTAAIAGDDYLCVMKFNYKTSFIHEFRAIADTNAINFVKHQGILPGKTAKIDEAFFVNIDTRDVFVLEKKFEIGGVKDFYISPVILGVTDNLSVKTQLETVRKVAERIYEEHYGPTVNMKPRVAGLMCRELANQQTFRMDNIIDNFTEEFPEAAPDFRAAADKLPVEKEERLPVPPSLVKRISKQTVKSRNGIEVKIPVRVYDNPKAMEYMREPDGTLTLIIRDIDEGKEEKE